MKKSKIFNGVIFAVVLLIPIIYSFFYLKSYWNPYGDLTGLKIAVVNLDEGENNENQGKEFVSGLEEDGTFNICQVSLDEANEGMQNNEYYATITIPSNFTKCLNSAGTTNKQIATITYSPNQASNYLASQIINSAVKTMETNLQGKINSKIAGTLSDKLKEVPENLEKISDGSGKILEGSENLNSGLKQINDGTTKLNNSYTEFDEGVNTAYEGSKTLDSGIKQANQGVGTLKNGASSLDNAITQINSGVNDLSEKGTEGIGKLTSGIEKVNSGAENLNKKGTTYVEGSTNVAKGTLGYIQGTTTLIEKVNNYIGTAQTVNNETIEYLKEVAKLANSSDPEAKKLGEQAQAKIAKLTAVNQGGEAVKAGEKELTKNNTTLQAGATQIVASEQTMKEGITSLYAGTQALQAGSSSLSNITTGVQSLKTALSQVKAGTTTLKEGVNTLGTGTTALSNGSTNLSNGLSKLNNSSAQVKSALNTLNDGTNSAYTGSTQLVSGVKEFKAQIDDGLKNTNTQLESLNGIEEFSEDPVEFKTEAYGEVDSYGVAFTPLFLCIGLWVGALMCYVVLYYDQRHRFGILDSTNKNKLLQNTIYLGIGALEGIIVGVLLKLGLGFEIQNMALYLGTSMLLGIVFMSIIQFFIRNFGDIGKLLALVVLVLQLAASGGTFPVETINKAFQAITPYLPMTYSIKLLKEILVPTATNFKWQYIGILFALTVVMIAVTYGVDIYRNKKKESK